MNELMQLLQSVGVSLPGMEGPDEEARRLAEMEAPVGQITVTGSPPTSTTPDQYLAPDAGPAGMQTAPLPSIGNREYIQRGLDAANDVPERQGRFGVRGTLRDILGTVGDAFLVQSGNDTVYAPQVERERQANAMAGMTSDARNTIERLATAGFGEEASGLYREMGAQDQRDVVARNQQATIDANSRKQGADSYEEGTKLMAQAAAAIAANPALFGTISRRMEQIKEMYGLGEEFEILDPAVAPPGYYQGMATSGTPSTTVANINANAPSRAAAIEQGDRRATTGERNAATAERRAAAAEAASTRGSSSNPTNASIAAPLLDKIARGERLTAGERDTLDRVAPPPPRNRRSRGDTPPPPPPTSPSRIRILSSRPKDN